MNIALITDLHFGARNDSLDFINYYRNFYQNTFFPILKERNIKSLIILGDTFDRRKYTNHVSLYHAKKMFFDILEEQLIETYIIVGNHDTAFKNTNEVNSCELFLNEYNNIIIIKDPKTINIIDVENVPYDEVDILILPWICKDNEEQSIEEIKKTNASIVFGHLELSGFSMYKGQPNFHGMDSKIFDRFDLVCSGHFHHRHRKGNIIYLGNPYELTWADYDDPRGFHIFDTDTLDLEFIENPYKMFTKILYNDLETDYEKEDVTQYNEKYIKLIIINKTDFYKFDMFLDRLHLQNPLELKIIEDFSEFEADVIEDDNLEIEDTSELLNDYVEATETDADKDKIKLLLRELFVEAQNIEVR